jgi:hypothetical protein
MGEVDLEKAQDACWDNQTHELHLMVVQLREELADIKDGNRIILDEKCASDEKHCGCVPVLRGEIERLRAGLDTIAGGHTDRFPDAPDIMAGTPEEFRSGMWTWSQKVARAALHTGKD